MRRSAILLVLLAAACDPMADERDALEAARERWDDASIDSYRMTFHYSCYCQKYGDFDIVVEGDSIVSAVHLLEEGEGPEGPVEIPMMTVEDMFAAIDRALDREPAQADLEYHGLGYPTRANFDFEENVADEEWGFGVRELVEIGG
jgi:hypothetical protein